jgi:hypothetical protein
VTTSAAAAGSRRHSAGEITGGHPSGKLLGWTDRLPLECTQGTDRRGEWLQLSGYGLAAEHGLDRGIV